MVPAERVMPCLIASGLMIAGCASTQKATDRGITAPVVIQEVKLDIPHAVIRDKRGGFVRLAVQVKPDGTVGYVHIRQSVSPELDAAAVKAAKGWRFTPGMKNGKAVPVETQLDMTFTFR